VRAITMLLLSSAAGFAPSPTHALGAVQQPPLVAFHPNLRAGALKAMAVTEEAEATFEAPATVLYRQPSPALQPREVISTMMSALHRSSWDEPRPYFGFEVALRFLAPKHQMAGAIPRDFQRYLRQPHKAALLAWAEYRWEGELTMVEDEAFQQVSVRSGPDEPWTSVRWMLTRVDAGDTPHTCWMVEGVFVEEPDDFSELPEWIVGASAPTSSDQLQPLDDAEMRRAFESIDADASGGISRDELASAVAQLGIARSESELAAVVKAVDDDRSGTIEFEEFAKLLAQVNSECHTGRFAAELTKSVRELETPSDVVETVMRALRTPDEPYPHAGSMVAIRYCSPTNRASRVSPSTFASYLSEPWYQILTEWDEMEIEEEEEGEEEAARNTCSVDVLVKRTDDESFTIVNWQLSRHDGRWLTDSLTLN